MSDVLHRIIIPGGCSCSLPCDCVIVYSVTREGGGDPTPWRGRREILFALLEADREPAALLAAATALQGARRARTGALPFDRLSAVERAMILADTAAAIGAAIDATLHP